jgi:hypothetical protein
MEDNIKKYIRGMCCGGANSFSKAGSVVFPESWTLQRLFTIYTVSVNT